LEQIMPIVSTPKLDAIDRRILNALQSDGRLTNLELADRVGLSPSPCLRRVRRLEAAELIEGYGAKLNRQKIGLGLTAFVAVSMERHRETDAIKFREAVMAMSEVVSCYFTSGDHDFLLEVVVAGLSEYRRFAMDKLPRVAGVKSIHSSFAIDVVKDNVPLPLDHLG
jgi:Lrp/AsnC family transcriptional regulator, leucine-responsive regulatory protein